MPNAFVTTAIQFSFAALSRRAIASYLGGLLLVVTAFVVARGVALLLDREVGQLLDPLGVTAIVRDDLTNGWTPIELNTRLIALEGSLLANRLLWLSIALGTLAVTVPRQPTRAGVDPNRLLIDLKTDDNTQKIKVQS